MAQLRINSSSKWKCQSLANAPANDSGAEIFMDSKQTVGHMKMDFANETMGPSLSKEKAWSPNLSFAAVSLGTHKE